MRHLGALIVTDDGECLKDLKRLLEVNHGSQVALATYADVLDRAQSMDGPVAAFFDLSSVAGREPFVSELDRTMSPGGRLRAIIGVGARGYPRSSLLAIDSAISATLKLPVQANELHRLMMRLNTHPGSHHRTRPPAYAIEGQTLRFVTHMPELISTLRELEVAAKHDVAVLLVGETGTGKTFLARLLHEMSPRCDRRFLPVACGALPNDLIESELFGHVRGAFTGADRSKEGKFQVAEDGTLLLDEIDVLGPEQQAKLLRVLETGEFEPVGSNETRKSNARVIVASNLDLETMIATDRFRADLYYRLKVLEFYIPPLRKRTSDIVPMALQFIDRFCETHSVAIDFVEPEFLESLKAYPWPGNVRELENLIRRTVLFARDNTLRADDLPLAVTQSRLALTEDTFNTPTSSALDLKVRLTEREAIGQALRAYDQNRSAAARALGISRVGLYKKMKKYGIVPPKRISAAKSRLTKNISRVRDNDQAATG